MLTEYQSKLVLENVGLIGYVIKKYNLQKEREEFKSIGYIALMKGIKKYDVAKGTKLSTYLVRCIENEFLLELKHRKSNKQVISYIASSLDREVCEGQKTYAEIIPDVRVNIEQDIIRQETIEKVFDEIEKLNYKEKLVLRHYYGINGYERIDQEEISKLINCSQSYISRIKTQAVNKLRRKLDKY